MRQELELLDYKRITKAIAYINSKFITQPDLADIAKEVNISPYHFQRVFTKWVGVSPKKFLQYITIEHAKKLLKEEKGSIFDTALDSGLSGPSRLHDLFIRIEGMTPGEYKNGGENLAINYQYADTPFGEVFIASTSKGICQIGFNNQNSRSLNELLKAFPKAQLIEKKDQFQNNALSFFLQDWNKKEKVKLHIKGSEFQLKVWEALLKIPLGKVTCYSDIAKQINKSKASRAVGTAIGNNPVAYLIPCHRVILSTGILGQYRWGTDKKAEILAWEAAH